MHARPLIPVLAISALAAFVPASTRAGAPASQSAAAPTASKPSATAPRAVLPFIADDYTKAVAEAKARKVPLFIESWAPW